MDYKTTLGNIFSARKNQFAVPNYQRAYSWEVGADKDKHIPQFFKDLIEHPKTVAQYHYGHFLFEQDLINKNKYWIIDGQQRMTTAVIFLSCIYKRLIKLPEYNKEVGTITFTSRPGPPTTQDRQVKVSFFIFFSADICPDTADNGRLKATCPAA